MRPFLTILLDSYRSLKSETIFWITLGLSVVVALIFLSIGFTDEGMSIFFGATDWKDPMISNSSPIGKILYIMLFSNIVAGIWLTFIATILALISCATIFPNTIKEGTAGMLMTKRPSRLLVFFAKLVGSLLFVFVQVGLFVVIVFVAFKWRLGVTNYSVFWYVPAVLLVFLNLYSVMVLIGVQTRSVITSILITMLVWGMSACMNWAIESLNVQYQLSQVAEGDQAPEGSSESPPEGDQTLKRWRDGLKTAHLFLPKNSPIMAEAEKKLVLDGVEGLGGFEALREQMGGEDKQEALDESVEELDRMDSRFYTIGTSCLFSGVMLSLAAWIFCRKEI